MVGITSASHNKGEWLNATLTSGGIVSLAGVLTSLVWGGFGGRIAMRVLVLTSPDSVRGVTSDAGFEIGEVSFATIFLFAFVAIVGGLIGFIGGLLRMVTTGPPRLVGAGVGVTCGVFFGAFLVAPDGVDFQILEPAWLAVALFVALPALWGSTTVILAEYLVRPGVVFQTVPSHLNDRRYGLVGWGVLALLTVVGAILLSNDVLTLV
jgi:hypothetical protein